MLKKIKSTLNLTKYLVNFILSVRYGKIYFFCKLMLSIFNSIISLLISILPGLLISELLGQSNAIVIICYIIVLCLIPLVQMVINNIIGKFIYVRALKIELELDKKFYRLVSIMDFETYDNPEMRILRERAQGILHGARGVVDQVLVFFSAIFEVLCLASVISILNPLIIVISAIISIIRTFCNNKTSKKKYELSKDMSQYDNHIWAYDYMINEAEYAKEIRLFNISEFLINKYVDVKEKLFPLEKKYYTLNTIPNGIYTILYTALQLFTYSYMVYSVIRNVFDVGYMTVYISVINQISGALGNLTGAYSELANNNYSTQELIDYLSYRPQNKCGNRTPLWKPSSVIEFRNVSFKYPGSEKYALKNLNITIKNGETLCIVGTNGAGKSTFIKLLMRLYSPTEGEILLDGINILEYSYDEYIKLFAPVFQDFAQFYLTIEENIALNDNIDYNKLNHCCNESGIRTLVNSLSQGYKTQIGKLIDPSGIDPSGGESQRIAIARACYSERDIFLLDEPTAALDPIQEFDIYSQFTNIISSKCTLLITHRLAAVKLADKVAVFDNGNVVEYGTHEKLLAAGHLYTEMYNKQSMYYREDIK